MRLRSPGRRRCDGILLTGLVSFVLTAPVFAQGKEQSRKGDEAQRAEAQALVDMVEGAAQGKPAAPGGLDLSWGRHYFLKAQGDRTYVPFVLLLPAGSTSAASVGLYLRVVARGGGAPTAAPAAEEGAKPGEAPKESPYAFEDLYFFQLPQASGGRPVQISRAFAVTPGEYDVYVALRERAPKSAQTAPKAGLVHQMITVPNFHVEGLTTSDVIFAQRVETRTEPVDTESQADHPFTFGQMEIQPATEHRFSKKEALQFVFWIYGAASDAQTKKPNVHIEYKFHRVEGEKQSYFNRTEPQILNAQSLPAEFDAAAGHQLAGSLADVPLESFPEGDYRLEIEIQDKAAGRQITRDVRFAVTP
jgi:hypothetical protein